MNFIINFIINNYCFNIYIFNMKYIKEHEWATIIHRHIFLLIIRYIKSIFFIIIFFIIFYISININLVEENQSFGILIFIILIMLIHYIVVKIIFYTINYYLNYIIIIEDEFIIIKSSLILKNDIEIIDIHNIIKFDSYNRWLLANIFWYWSIIIEQQKNDVKEIHFVANPHLILNIFQRQIKKRKNIKEWKKF